MPLQQSHTQTQKNASVSTGYINITAAELKLIERHAYDKGFADGRTYERLNFSIPPTPAATPCPAPVACQAKSAPTKAQTRLPLKPTAPIPQPNPTPDYSTSGPAQPLSP